MAKHSHIKPDFNAFFYNYLLWYYQVMTTQSKTIQDSITSKLNDAFSPEHLEVVNESFMHNVPEGSESHFKVTIVCDDFKDKMLIARHRLVNKVLSDELQKEREEGSRRG